ncbi:unnamed protein product [Soboliphyme baturini]|uniref:R3H domain-containing protein n=1 Tax=Soboliphyme baturini TaxID=241478 RepID=A0A183J1W3_9BILA|nr:unnamed protein product [Soboliphyme baturini]
MLSCGLHKCSLLCHLGKCPTCQETSFDELHCLCGSAVLYPPIPCGTAPPSCDKPCTRQHSCSHPVTHTCHSEPSCPPCTYLMDKPCFGNHEVRPNIPCFINGISCGKPCGKDLPCKVHRCRKDCHPMPCLLDGEVCKLRCEKPRQDCGHFCNLPCHGESPCPESRCEMNVLAAAFGINCNEKKVAPNYSEYLRKEYESDPSFAMAVEAKLCQLVESLKLTSEKQLCFSFQSMNAEHRKFIHQYAEYFRLSSSSYDQEPLRNVVVVAERDKSTTPAVLLSEAMRL